MELIEGFRVRQNTFQYLDDYDVSLLDYKGFSRDKGLTLENFQVPWIAKLKNTWNLMWKYKSNTGLAIVDFIWKLVSQLLKTIVLDLMITPIILALVVSTIITYMTAVVSGNWDARLFMAILIVGGFFSFLLMFFRIISSETFLDFISLDSFVPWLTLWEYDKDLNEFVPYNYILTKDLSFNRSQSLYSLIISEQDLDLLSEVSLKDEKSLKKLNSLRMDLRNYLMTYKPRKAIARKARKYY